MDGMEVLWAVIGAVIVLVGVVIIINIANAGQAMSSANGTVNQTTYAKDFNIGATNVDLDGNRYIAQTFLAKYNTINSIDLNLSDYNAILNNTGRVRDLNVSVRAVVGGLPSGVALYSTTIASTSMTLKPAKLTNVPFYLTGLTVGAPYAVILDYNDASSVDGNHYVTSVSTGNAYASGNLYGSKNGVAWYSLDANDLDMYFNINFTQVSGWDLGTVALVGIIVLALGAGVIIGVMKMFWAA